MNKVLKYLFLSACVSAIGMAEDENLSTDAVNSTSPNLDFAQQENPNISHNLGKVQLKENSDESSDSIIISERSIKESNSKDIAEALRYTPGVFITPPSGNRGEPSVNIRGFSTTQIGFYLDGIPVSSIYDRQTDWGQFSAFGIQEINVHKGYVSPVYGTNAIGGAVNIITSKPTNELEVSTKYQFITNNEHRANFQIGQNKGMFYYQVGVSYVNRKSFNTSNSFKPVYGDTGALYQGRGEVFNTYFNNLTLRAKVGINPNDKHEYSLNFIYQKGAKGGPVSNIDPGVIWDWPRYDKTTIYLLGKSYMSDKVSLGSRLYYDSFVNALQANGGFGKSAIGYSGNYVKTPLNSKSTSSYYDDNTFGIIENLDIALTPNQLLQVGANVRNDNHTAINFSADASNGLNVVTEAPEKFSDITTSLFAQYDATPNRFLHFLLSGSYDRNDMVFALYKGSRDQLGYVHGFNLQGLANLILNDNFSFHANIGHKTRIPTLKERYTSAFGSRIPNPNIGAESYINYELGAHFKTDSTKADVSVFFNDINNIIVSVPMPDNSCVLQSKCTRLENMKEGYAYGAEVSINQALFNEHVNLGANYSYIYKAVINKNSKAYYFDGSRLTNYPNHFVNLYAKFSPSAKFDIITHLSYQGQMWVVVWEGSENNIAAGYRSISDIFLADIMLYFRPIKHIELGAGVSNLLDRNYYYYPGYPMAGRRYSISIGYKF